LLALKTAIVLAAVLTPLQIVVGDFHGLNTLEHQPQKIAAMEGIWETEKGAPLLLFAIPNKETRTNDYEIAIPNVASFILTHDWDGELQGLNDFIGEHPPVAPVFFGFRIMVGTGMLMLLLSWCGAIYIMRKKTLPRWLLKTYTAMTFSGWVATLAGWYVTEIGRQPYLVSGILRTTDAVTDIAPVNVAISLAMYSCLYLGLLVAYLLTLRNMAKRSAAIEDDIRYQTPQTQSVLLQLNSINTQTIT
jgi:cytochrome d ubiquinol oxidase subunit I